MEPIVVNPYKQSKSLQPAPKRKSIPSSQRADRWAVTHQLSNKERDSILDRQSQNDRSLEIKAYLNSYGQLEEIK
jgi:hypothetical protein